jgi:effector-binding domain-containing protein
MLRIETYLNQIERENMMTIANVVTKQIEPMLVASIHEVLPEYGAIGSLYPEIFAHLGRQGAKPGSCGAIWHDPTYRESDIDGEAIVCLAEKIPGNDRIKVYELPIVDRMACIVHHGSYRTITSAYNLLLKWIEENTYQIVGASHELYIHGGAEQDNESYITEIQFPIANG